MISSWHGGGRQLAAFSRAVPVFSRSRPKPATVLQEVSEETASKVVAMTPALRRDWIELILRNWLGTEDHEQAIAARTKIRILTRSRTFFRVPRPGRCW